MSALSDAISELQTNAAQWQAFQTQGHCAVLAPPGSGKTKLLTTKLAHSLATGIIIPPRGAACITMTNEAALQLRRQLRVLGVGHRPNLFIGTVHGFALSCIMSPFAAAAGRGDLGASRMATDANVKESFGRAFTAAGFEPHERRYVRSTVERARQRLDLSGDVRLGGTRISALARGLQDDLCARRLYDFHDLVRHAVDLVESNAWVRNVLAATYPRVYVDEYQDLAPGLDRIVRAITLDGTDSTLVAVGDPDQAIYAFSGVDPELVRRVAADDGVTAVHLQRNYRSGQALIDIALRVLQGPRVIEGQRTGGTVIVHPAPGGPRTQASTALQLVQRALANGSAPEKVAVLAPWGSDRDLCAQFLRQASIPVFCRSEGDWAATPLTTLLEAMAAWATRREGAGVDLAELLERLDRVSQNVVSNHSTRRDVVQALLGAVGNSPAGELVGAIVNAALRPLAGGDVSNEDAHELRRMRHALGDGGIAEHMTVGDLGVRARAPGQILAATIHAAKGLEFDSVVIVGADNAALPGFTPTVEEEAEGRRKFYVAITRARHDVHVVYTDQRIAQSGNTYSVRPSPFIAELGL